MRRVAERVYAEIYFWGCNPGFVTTMVARCAQALPMMTGSQTLDTLKTVDPDSVWLFNQPDYPPNPPTRIFSTELRLALGGDEIHVLHHPGHAAPQTSSVDERNIRNIYMHVLAPRGLQVCA